MSKNSPSLLIVDDSEQNLSLTKSILGDMEVDIDVAMSGEEALSKISVKDYFLIIMDVQMPKMDGFETVALIRENKKYENVPIIFLTALYSDELEIKGYEEGAVDYIIKPFKKSILISKITIFLKIFYNKKQSKSI